MLRVIALLGLLLVYLNYEAVRYNGKIFPSRELTVYSPKGPLYNCSYSGLWCSCHAKKGGGCSVGCSSNIYFTLSNRTSCPQYEDFMLAGFTLV